MRFDLVLARKSARVFPCLPTHEFADTSILYVLPESAWTQTPFAAAVAGNLNSDATRTPTLFLIDDVNVVRIACPLTPFEFGHRMIAKADPAGGGVSIIAAAHLEYPVCGGAHGVLRRGVKIHISGGDQSKQVDRVRDGICGLSDPGRVLRGNRYGTKQGGEQDNADCNGVPEHMMSR